MVAQLDDYHLVLLKASDSERALRWFEDYHLSHGAGIMDCLIGASALRLGKPFYTLNVKHFRVFPKVNVQKPYGC